MVQIIEICIWKDMSNSSALDFAFTASGLCVWRKVRENT